MRVGNVFSHVCLSVCLSVFPSVQAIMFELFHIETSFLVCRYIFTISTSSLSRSIKVIGSGSMSYEEIDNFTYFNMLILYLWLHVINYVKVTHQGEGHIKVKVKNIYLLSNFMSNFTYFNMLILCVWLQVINKFKFIHHQGEGHIKVKVKYLHPFKFYVAHTL